MIKAVPDTNIWLQAFNRLVDHIKLDCVLKQVR